MVETEKTRVDRLAGGSARKPGPIRRKAAHSAHALPEAVAKEFIPDLPWQDMEVIFVAKTAAAEEKLRERIPVEKKGQAGWVAYHHGAAPRKSGTKIETTAYSPSSRARALLQGYKIADADLKEAGGAFDLEQVRTLLNGVSRQAIEKRVKEGSLLAVPGPSNRRRYPTAQFTRDGLILGLKEVQEALPTRNPWAVLNFFVRPDHRLGGRKPIDVLRLGDVELVVSAAQGMGVQGG